jgi:CHAT domain-containing protein/tetratricopeptide (TPR) repeat protein
VLTLLLSVVFLSAAAIPHSHAMAPVHRSSAHTRSDSALMAQARVQPDSLRAALSRSFAGAASSANQRDLSAQLIRARSLANAYAVAWKDSFLVRQVARFEASPPAQRRARVIADSLRLAGNVALAREGVPGAMALWRESLRRAMALNDPAAIAPALVALGAGFYRAANLDSATVYLERGKTLATQAGDLRTAGNALGILASVRKDRGEFARAIALYKRASVIRARSGDTRGMAADQNNLGLIAQEQGDVGEATRAFEEALTINRRDGRQSVIALNLSNLARLASSTSDYARSDSLYKEALVLQRAAGDRAETAFVLQDLGRLQMRRGDYTQALTTLGEALRIHEASGATGDAIAVRSDLAALKSAAGDPEGALTILREGQREANAVKAPAELRAKLALASGDLAIQFGTFAEANASYLLAEQLFETARNEGGRAQAQQGRALLLHLRDDDEGSLALLEKATRSQTSVGDRRSAAVTQLLMAEVQSARGDTALAKQAASSARQTMHALGDVVGEAAALDAMGDLELRRGSNRTAEQLYRHGIAALGNRPATDVRWRLHSGLAEALRGRSAIDAAAKEFRSAIAIAEQTAAGLRLEERRSGFLADKWSVYTQLAMLEQSRGRPAEAFAVSERMRARQMLDLLARGRTAAPQVASREEQDLRRRIAELTRELEVRGPYQSGTREPALSSLSADAIRGELDTAHKAYARLLLDLRENAPDYARLVSAQTLTWRSVASRLKGDEALLEYLLGDSTSTVFVVTHDTVAAIDLHVSHQVIADLVEFARASMERPDISTSKELWRVPLRRLYLHLIQPVEQRGYLSGKRTLVIAPHAELHFLPFGALIAPGRTDHFLIERLQLAYTPSASAWVQLGERRVPASSRNVLAMAPHVDRLPASRQEVLAISRIYGKAATVRIGAQASKRALRADLPRAGTLHLATFGVLNKHNPLFSFVELAPSGQDDGRLEVNDVFGLGLSGQLVVLSACQTALASGAIADVPPGDDWVGLVEAFLQAGASNVLASLWPVDDRATATLMEEFHKRLAAGRPAVAALADAQRTLLRDARTARPFYWAGFVINGGGGNH